MRSYLRSIVGDLSMRGVIRHRGGQALDEILRIEGAAVTRALIEDVKEIGIEIGGDMAKLVAGALGQHVHQSVDRVLGAGADWLANAIAGKMRR